MARRTVLVSDISGEEIPDGKGATVTINFRDARRGTIVLDVTDKEAEQMGAKGRRQSRRGRKPRQLKPGDYVEEVPSGSKPIEGVGTAIAARKRGSDGGRRETFGR
jgi:hypothetical protein